MCPTYLFSTATIIWPKVLNVHVYTYISCLVCYWYPCMLVLFYIISCVVYNYFQLYNLSLSFQMLSLLPLIYTPMRTYIHLLSHSYFLLFVIIFISLFQISINCIQYHTFCFLERLQNMTYSTTSCAEFTKTFLLPTFHTFHKVEFNTLRTGDADLRF